MSLGRTLLLGSTLIVAVMATALLSDALPVWLGIGLLFCYCAVILAGVMIPQLAMFAPVLWRIRHGRPEVVLTFDDGPSPESTRKVLAALSRCAAHATFFVLGGKALAEPQVLREIAAAGHEIGIHGDRHDRLLSLRHPDRIASDLERVQAAVATATGQRARFFRPPVGHISPRTAVAARRLGLTLVGWSVRGRDGLAGTTADSAFRRVAAGLHPGAIVLLHDASERGQYQPAGVEALPAILEEARRRGLRCVSLSQALAQVPAQ
jgi:peptidoglycan/xylan/chitin deacetylase (PgdA/CDA1 family)